MFRFTIRDLLWLMVVVGVAAFAYREQLTAQEARQDAASLKTSLTDEQAKARKVFVVGSRVDASTHIKPGETIVVSFAEDGMSATFNRKKVSATDDQPQP